MDFDSSIKKFKFDLQMGRFKEYIEGIYSFKGNVIELKSFSDLLLKNGFRFYFYPKDGYTHNNAITIDSTDNTMIVIYVGTHDDRVNEIPDYIKEYFYNE